MIRTAVFVDYEDCVRRGHDAFATDDVSIAQLNPLRLATQIVGSTPSDRALTDVRVYRSVPDPRRDPKAFGDVIAQTERWSEEGVVVVRRSAHGGLTLESSGAKGLAVALAVDLIVHAIHDVFDVVIVFSADPDLAPAIGAVLDNTWKSVEVAAWRRELGPSDSLRVTGETVRCHWMDLSIYEAAFEGPARASDQSAASRP